MPATFGIVDLFAAPGGLGEGFATLDGGRHAPFFTAVSILRGYTVRRVFNALRDQLP